MESTITCYLSGHTKTHVSLQQENVLIRILFAVAGSTQSKNKKNRKTNKQKKNTCYLKGSRLKNNPVLILLVISNKAIKQKCRCYQGGAFRPSPNSVIPSTRPFWLSLYLSPSPGLFEMRSISDMLCKYMQIPCEFLSTPLCLVWPG